MNVFEKGDLVWHLKLKKFGVLHGRYKRANGYSWNTKKQNGILSEWMEPHIELVKKNFNHDICNPDNS